MASRRRPQHEQGSDHRCRCRHVRDQGRGVRSGGPSARPCRRAQRLSGVSRRCGRAGHGADLGRYGPGGASSRREDRRPRPAHGGARDHRPGRRYLADGRAGDRWHRPGSGSTAAPAPSSRSSIAPASAPRSTATPAVASMPACRRPIWSGSSGTPRSCLRAPLPPATARTGSTSISPASARRTPPRGRSPLAISAPDATSMRSSRCWTSPSTDISCRRCWMAPRPPIR